MDKLVSIITVVLNGEKYLEDTIKSVISQTYKNIEYIVVDGGSTDNTLSIISMYKDKIDVVISEKDKGIYDAMNKGIKKSSGDIIGIINSDDYYYNDNVVQAIVECFDDDDCDILYGDKIKYDLVTGEKLLINVDRPNSLKEVNISIVHPTVFVRRKIYMKKMFDEKYKIVADRAFFYWAYRQGYNFFKKNKVIAVMRTGGISSKCCQPVKEGFYVRREYLGIMYAILFVIRHLVSSIYKKLK